MSVAIIKFSIKNQFANVANVSELLDDLDDLRMEHLFVQFFKKMMS